MSAHPDRTICSWSRTGTAVPDRDLEVELEAEERAGAGRAQANHRAGTLDASWSILSLSLDLNTPDGGNATGAHPRLSFLLTDVDRTGSGRPVPPLRVGKHKCGFHATCADPPHLRVRPDLFPRAG